MPRPRAAVLGPAWAILAAVAFALLRGEAGLGAAAALALGAPLGAAAVWLLHSLGDWYFLAPVRAAQRAMAERELRYRVLAEDSADLVLLFAGGGTRPLVSKAVTTLLGYTAEAARAMPILAYLHVDDRAAAKHRLKALSADEPRASMTVRLKHSDGHYIWAEAILFRIEQASGAVETVVTIRDISESHREEQVLREATLAARRAQAEADEANRAKTEFLACMSHEIRTPLNSVIGFASLLLGRVNLDPQVRLYGERIQAAGKALLTVVDDILDFSRVEAGVVELKPMPFSLPGLIDECVSIVQQSAVAKNLSVHVNLMERLPPAVLGDAARLRQILLNLLNNAIKFTQEGSVLLDIRHDRTAGTKDCLKFAVIDTGIGIAREDLPRLFKRFAQVDASIRRTFGGTGLGLAISKRLVDLMGGRIGVESEKGIGSTFWFTLPLPPTRKVVAGEADGAPIALAPRRILLVEDVPINQDLVCHMLEASGHNIDIVCNGAEAIMAVMDADYDVVLMDIQMPYLDGLSATRMIRALPHACRDVPIVAMTANVLPEQRRLALDAGMVDVIHKPFSVAQIFAVIERVGGATTPSARSAGTGDGRSGSIAAERGPVPDDAEPFATVRGADPAILHDLSSIVGDAKVRQLLEKLALSLAGRFDGDPATPDGRTALKRQAHASVSSSGMLGFSRFAASCRALEHAAEDETFCARAAALREEAAEVIASLAHFAFARGAEAFAVGA